MQTGCPPYWSCSDASPPMAVNRLGYAPLPRRLPVGVGSSCSRRSLFANIDASCGACSNHPPGTIDARQKAPQCERRQIKSLKMPLGHPPPVYHSSTEGSCDLLARGEARFQHEPWYFEEWFADVFERGGLAPRGPPDVPASRSA